MLSGLHNQQYTPDSGDSQRPIFSTTIIAKYANNREDKACAPPARRVQERGNGERNGDAHDTWRKSFGQGGARNICSSCKQETSGFATKINFKIGDVVLLKENQSPRNRRPMAKVVVTHPDDQGQVRPVTVLTSNGSNLERPINKLVLLVEAQQTPGFPDEEPEHY